MAIYKFGLIATPVCPTCSWCGRQPISATGREQAVAAPKDFAKFSIIPQFSGPFNPLPAETTSSASGKRISPSGFFVEITFIAAAPPKPFVSSTGQLVPVFSG